MFFNCCDFHVVSFIPATALKHVQQVQIDISFFLLPPAAEIPLLTLNIAGSQSNSVGKCSGSQSRSEMCFYTCTRLNVAADV